MSAAVKVRPARYGGIYDAILDGQYARASWRDWIADTSTGCGCEIGGFTGCEPTRVYRHYRQLDPDKYRPHGDGGLIVDTIAGTTYITIHATEPPLGVDLPTPPAVVMDGQDPLIGDDT